MSTLPQNAAAQRQSPLITTPHGNRVEEAVREFETLAHEVGVGRITSQALREVCRQVADLTDTIFPGENRIEVRGDPEIPEELHFTFEVAATGVNDAVAKNDEWHRSLRRAVGGRAVLFCLSIGRELMDPRDLSFGDDICRGAPKNRNVRPGCIASHHRRINYLIEVRFQRI